MWMFVTGLHVWTNPNICYDFLWGAQICLIWLIAFLKQNTLVWLGLMQFAYICVYNDLE